METILFLIIVNFYCSMQSLKRGQLRPPLYIVDVNLCEGAAMGVHSTIEKLTSETCKTSTLIDVCQKVVMFADPHYWLMRMSWGISVTRDANQSAIKSLKQSIWFKCRFQKILNPPHTLMSSLSISLSISITLSMWHPYYTLFTVLILLKQITILSLT